MHKRYLPRMLQIYLVGLSLLAATAIAGVFFYYYISTTDVIRNEIVRSGQLRAERWLSALGSSGDEIARIALKNGPTIASYEYFSKVMAGTDMVALQMKRPGTDRTVLFARDSNAICQPDLRAALSEVLPTLEGARLIDQSNAPAPCSNVFVAVAPQRGTFGGLGTETRVIVDRTDFYAVAQSAMNRTLELSAILAVLGVLGTIVTAVLAYVISQRDRRMRHMADHDALTGLPNRFFFNRALNLWASGRVPRPATLLLIDLDGFKAVNDSLGHAYGDILLKRIAERLTFVAPNDVMVARLGGDEFAMVLWGEIAKEDSLALGRKLIESVSAINRIGDVPVVIGASVGIAAIPNDASDVEILQQRADIALYRVKESGKGEALRFNPSMETEYQVRYRVRQSLRTALDEDGLSFMYQPIHRAADGALVGFEALARLPDGAGGFYSPRDFIPIAEEMSKIGQLGTHALKAACAAAAGLPPHLRVTVNISPLQLTPDLPTRVKGALDATGLDPRRLELELTESREVEVTPQVVAVLKECRQLGVTLALDDFDTSYTKITALWQIPFSRLKIDRLVFNTAIKNKNPLDILRALTALPSTLELGLTAAGVESEDQRRIAIACGFDEVQGYLFSKPVPQSSLLEYASADAYQPRPHLGKLKRIQAKPAAKRKPATNGKGTPAGGALRNGTPAQQHPVAATYVPPANSAPPATSRPAEPKRPDAASAKPRYQSDWLDFTG